MDPRSQSNDDISVQKPINRDPMNVPVVTISWIFFFGLCFVIFLVLSLCSDSRCACCRCLRCCRETQSSNQMTQIQKIRDRKRNISSEGSSLMVVSNSEGLNNGGGVGVGVVGGGVAMANNNCYPSNGSGGGVISGGAPVTKIPSGSSSMQNHVGNSGMPSHEFYC